MAEETGQSNATRNWIGVGVAALLTVAIVTIVFWKSHPNEPPADEEPRVMDVDQMPSGIEEAFGTWRAYVGPVVMVAHGRPAKDFDFGMRVFMLIDDDSRFYIRAQRIVLNDANAASDAKLTEDQIKKLKAIDPPLLISDEADRDRAIAAWRKWESADDTTKSAAEVEVLDA